MPPMGAPAGLSAVLCPLLLFLLLPFRSFPLLLLPGRPLSPCAPAAQVRRPPQALTTGAVIPRVTTAGAGGRRRASPRHVPLATFTLSHAPGMCAATNWTSSRTSRRYSALSCVLVSHSWWKAVMPTTEMLPAAGAAGGVAGMLPGTGQIFTPHLALWLMMAAHQPMDELQPNGEMQQQR